MRRDHNTLEPAPSSAATIRPAIALGLLARSAGDVGYYLIEALTDDPPYPSPADVAYVTEVVLWIGGRLLLYWALETSVLEEMHGTIDVLVTVWGLIIVAITLIRGEGTEPRAEPVLVRRLPADHQSRPFVCVRASCPFGSLAIPRVDAPHDVLDPRLLDGEVHHAGAGGRPARRAAAAPASSRGRSYSASLAPARS